LSPMRINECNLSKFKKGEQNINKISDSVRNDGILKKITLI